MFAMTSAFSWQNSISVCPASFRIPRPNLPVTPGVSCLPTFAIQSPIMKMTSFWGTARISNQSILKEISPGCSLEGMVLKLELQYFGHLMQRAASLEKTLMLGGIGGRRRNCPQAGHTVVTEFLAQSLSGVVCCVITS